MRLFIRRMMNFSIVLRRVAVVAAVLLALFANIVDSQENESLKLNNAKECNPKGSNSSSSSSSSKATGSSTTTTCENGYHCVFNGHSSIGGYCINNENKSESTQMDFDMPEGLQSVCFICNDDDDFDNNFNNQKSISNMSKPNDKVGVFTCEELDQHGKSGSIPQTNCDIFQRMIHDNNLCGCTADEEDVNDTAAEATAEDELSSSSSSEDAVLQFAGEGYTLDEDDIIEDIHVLDNYVNPYSSRTNNANGNNNKDDKVQSLTTSVTSDSFSNTITAAAAATIIVATLSMILQSILLFY